MLSSVLRSKRAIHVNITIMRAFVKLRELMATHKDLARKLNAMEKKYDAQFKVVFDAIRALMTPPEPKKKEIGFHVKEKKAKYGSKLNEQNHRIQEILSTKDIYVTEKTQKKYLKYLKKNIETPCQITGIEDFPWEEPYIFSGWDKEEYEELKKTQSSYEDKYDLIKFEDLIDGDYGILVKVKRISE